MAAHAPSGLGTRLRPVPASLLPDQTPAAATARWSGARAGRWWPVAQGEVCRRLSSTSRRVPAGLRPGVAAPDAYGPAGWCWGHHTKAQVPVKEAPLHR